MRQRVQNTCELISLLSLWNISHLIVMAQHSSPWSTCGGSIDIWLPCMVHLVLSPPSSAVTGKNQSHWLFSTLVPTYVMQLLLPHVCRSHTRHRFQVLLNLVLSSPVALLEKLYQLTTQCQRTVMPSYQTPKWAAHLVTPWCGRGSCYHS